VGTRAGAPALPSFHSCLQNQAMETLSFPEASIPSLLRRQILDLQDEAWPPDEAQHESRKGHDLVDGDTVLAADWCSQRTKQCRACSWTLVCSPATAPLKGFYEKSGRHELDGTVLVGGTPANPFPSDQPGIDKVTMGDFFSSRARRNGPAVPRHTDRALPRADRQALVGAKDGAV
jgi:aminoglycoside 2'-N-acetyltransferase I